MKQHKIIIVGEFPHDVSLIQGGIQASTYGLALSLKRHMDVEVIALPVNHDAAPRVENVNGISVTFLDVPYKYMMSTIFHLKSVWNQIRKSEKTIVHIHGTGLLQGAVCVLAKLRKTPFVWTMHGITAKETLNRFHEQKTFANYFRYLFYAMLERSQLTMSSEVIVDTVYVQQEISGMRSQTHVIPQGIFMSEFADMHAMPRDENLVVSIGVMDPRKGHHLTLDAFAKAKKTIPDAKLVIAGAEATPDYSRQLQDKASALGIEDSVSIAVNLSRAEVIALLGKASLFALHSQEELQGIALCEALAAGVPIAASRVGGIPYVVTDRQDGVLVDYGDVDGFAEGMIDILSDSAKHLRMSRDAKEASARFDWDNVGLRIMEIYKSVLDM